MGPRTVSRLFLSRSIRHLSARGKHSAHEPLDVTNPLPATFFRGGTSKGIFINRDHLPADTASWARIFLGIMGSPDPVFKRQLDGMGGGVSSLSKVCVVGKPSNTLAEQGVDVEYTFAQVGVVDDTVDYSGNCGNLSSVVGAFAVDEVLCSPKCVDGRATVRTFNTNTGKIIDLTFPVATVPGTNAVKSVLDRKEVALAGVPGMASRISLDFVSPGGACTGKLLPSGHPVDTITIPTGQQYDMMTDIRASLVDATNPTVFVSHRDLYLLLSQPNTDVPIPFSDARVLSLLETIRQLGAQRMGLDPSAQAQPKIAVLRAPNDADRVSGVDIRVHAISMGIPHRAVPLTVGLCLGIAAHIEGTIAHDIVTRTRVGQVRMGVSRTVCIAHPSGLVNVGVETTVGGGVESVNVIRTGRKLMKGAVWW